MASLGNQNPGLLGSKETPIDRSYSILQSSSQAYVGEDHAGTLFPSALWEAQAPREVGFQHILLFALCPCSCVPKLSFLTHAKKFKKEFGKHCHQLFWEQLG